jgi:hypothetical protein
MWTTLRQYTKPYFELGSRNLVSNNFKISKEYQKFLIFNITLNHIKMSDNSKSTLNIYIIPTFYDYKIIYNFIKF